MKAWLLAPFLGLLLLLPSCTLFAIRAPDKPIHFIVDINIKIQKQLEEDFAFMEEATPKEPGNKKP